MLIRKAVRYRLEPLPEQGPLLSRAVGCVRFVWIALSLSRRAIWSTAAASCPTETWPST
ncbi:helix-turn-helix domain-containing protein [Acidiferrobacter thiooxydans]|uniref:helix-turn-helix domain-containing protein n=1 Tax=Acidiferrobacter thiooxydans TaxID=163359 RepID=UPI001B882215|nr:helix-turn-helix domain-containing protein [Acidiferrobacter thiooxydans]